MITFIHTADIHFGMENYGKIDQATGIHTRLLDFDRAFNFCIDTAIERNVDFFLFAGDAYKTAYPSPTQQRLLLKAFLRLYKAGIPVVNIIGNHDHPLSFGKAHSLDIFNQLPIDGFTTIAKPASIVLQTKSGPVQIVGIPWPTRNTLSLSDTHAQKSNHEITEYISNCVTNIIDHFATQLDPQLPAVLAGHLTVSSGIFSGSEKRAIYGTDPIFLPSQLARAPFDYVALGHLHRHQDLNEGCYPPLVYSGSIERIDFGERKEEKGFCLVRLINKKETVYEFIKTPIRPFLQIEVHLTAEDNPTERILQELTHYSLNNAIVKIIYHMPAELHEKVDIAAIQRACQEAMYVVGIFPQRTIEQRTQRAALNVSMDFKTLLTTYFAQKPEYKNDCEKLVEAALQLAQNVDDQAHQ